MLLHDLEMFERPFRSFSIIKKHNLRLNFLQRFKFENCSDLFFFLQAIIDDIKDNKPQKDIITDVKELSVKYFIPEHEVIAIVS